MGRREWCVRFALHDHLRLTRGNHLDVHFLEASSLTGDNVEAPFLLCARSILLAIESGQLDPDKAGSGVSYGDRALRRVNSSGRLSFGSLSHARRKSTVKIRLPGITGRCC